MQILEQDGNRTFVLRQEWTCEQLRWSHSRGSADRPCWSLRCDCSRGYCALFALFGGRHGRQPASVAVRRRGGEAEEGRSEVRGGWRRAVRRGSGKRRWKTACLAVVAESVESLQSIHIQRYPLAVAASVQRATLHHRLVRGRFVHPRAQHVDRNRVSAADRTHKIVCADACGLVE